MDELLNQPEIVHHVIGIAKSIETAHAVVGYLNSRFEDEFVAEDDDPRTLIAIKAITWKGYLKEHYVEACRAYVSARGELLT